MGLSRKEFAIRAGVPARTITNICCGGRLSRATAARLGDVIGWSIDEVIAGQRQEATGEPADTKPAARQTSATAEAPPDTPASDAASSAAVRRAS